MLSRNQEQKGKKNHLLYLCFVFESLRVDEPLFAGSDDHRLLRPPVVWVTVNALLLLEQGTALLQH